MMLLEIDDAGADTDDGAAAVNDVASIWRLFSPVVN